MPYLRQCFDMEVTTIDTSVDFGRNMQADVVFNTFSFHIFDQESKISFFSLVFLKYRCNTKEKHIICHIIGFFINRQQLR